MSKDKSKPGWDFWPQDLGSSQPSSTSQPTSSVGADGVKALKQGGGNAQGQMGLGSLDSVPSNVPGQLAGGGANDRATNISVGAGIAGGFPEAAGGDGTGKHGQTIIGQTNARPRSSSGGFLGNDVPQSASPAFPSTGQTPGRPRRN